MKFLFLRKCVPHLISILAFTCVLYIYYSPIISGKKLVQNDFTQAIGSLKEAITYNEKSSEEILWSNSMFSGMPVWRGYSTNVIKKFHTAITNTIPSPILLGLVGFVGFYILMIAMGGNYWIGFMGGAAFVFSSFNICSIEAGHINKVYDMALMAPVLAGIIFTFKKKYWIGSAITALFLSLHIFYGHYQITYYLLIIILFIMGYYLFESIKQKKLNDFFKAAIILLLSAIVAIGPNVSQIWTTKVYSKNTQREGSELSTKIENSKKGLDKDYTFAWSNGISEVFSILIPYIHGGSSNEDLGQNSASYTALLDNGVPKAEAKSFVKNIPLYWGSQPFTSGPVYFGATIVFLFILSLFLIKDNIKWWILGLSILAIFLSWGKNFPFLSDFFYDYIPLYNKFRSVTMILSIAQLTFPLMGGYLIIKIVNKEIALVDFLKGLKWTLIICGGTTLIFALMGGLFFDFTSDNDSQLKQQMPEWLMQAIFDDRANKLRTDAFRSLFLIVALSVLLWSYFKEKINSKIFYISICVLILFDLTLVDKRYLNNESFKPANYMNNKVFVPSLADEMILQDKDLYYRIMNFAKSPFQDATTSYFHKSAGGYSAIKLGRYQDLIERQLSKNNLAVYNMLNIKYFIVPDQKTQQPMAQFNKEAMGNAWFVEKIITVNNADEEMSSLDSIKPKQIAYIDKSFAKDLKNFNFPNDSNAFIKLISYHPNRLKYKSHASNNQFAVFSDIYYQPGWNAYINEKLVPHLRTNYLLRGLEIPKGDNTVEFRFEPEHYFMTEKISLFGSILLIIFILGIIGREIVIAAKATKATLH